MSTTADRDRLITALGPAMTAVGLDLEEVEVTSAGRRRLVRVAVDKVDGLTLDNIADATQLVSQRLDDADLMGDASYTLEVSSPGTDRPLTLPRHWHRNLGRLVTVATAGGGFTGRITEAGETAASVDVDGHWHQVAYSEVVRARVEIEFNRKED